ncbi:hypothetical protein QBC39DRAFT_328968 [Podospora conica]|nr:hypothetical protein QBC39DRAFT_328968 [Schizothecium conicum]
MKLTFGFTALWLSMAMVQGQAVGQERLLDCTPEVVEDIDCANVIAPVACYNQYKFTSPNAFTCIEGENDADKARMFCKCARCVSESLVQWVNTNRLCEGNIPKPTVRGRRGAAALWGY